MNRRVDKVKKAAEYCAVKEDADEDRCSEYQLQLVEGDQMLLYE